MSKKIVKQVTIGIDIGGTNSDCVVLDRQQRLLCRAKTPTTADITTGIDNLFRETFQSPDGVIPSDVQALFVSSTHATNALLEARSLYRVGLIRIASNNPVAIPPCMGWPEELRRVLDVQMITLPGGYEVDGRCMAPLDQCSLQRAVDELVSRGTQSIAIVGVFSPLYPDQELAAAALIAQRYGAVPVTCSKDVGTTGFIERENAAILNAALKRCVHDGFAEIAGLCKKWGLACPLYAVQNNGSTMSLEQACAFPISLLAAGPTNSCMGAAHLSELTDCVIVDIGGTSTDIGMVKKGVARRSCGSSSIAGVSLNFSMPDVLSIALGGGSMVACVGDDPRIGPESVGASLFQRAKFSGGDVLTLTDCALQSGFYDGLGPVAPPTIGTQDACTVMERAASAIAAAVERFAAIEKDLPVLFVGGGSELFPVSFLQNYFPRRRVVKPPYADVANAFGAACASVSGLVDETILLEQRDAAIAVLCEKATERAVEGGADPRTITISDITVLPYAYVAKPMARVRICAAGRLMRSRE